MVVQRTTARVAALEYQTLEGRHPKRKRSQPFRLFRGFFEQGVNIAKPEEVLELARQAPLDFERFVIDFEAGMTRQTILDEYAEAVNTYMVYAIPTVIFNGEDSIIGAVPSAEYEKVLEKLGVSRSV